MPQLEGIIVHYNGHGTWKREPHRKTDAGWWACANDEYIKIEEVFSAISDNLAKKGPPIEVTFIADCCGAAGAYHRLMMLEKERRLLLSNRIGMIWFRFPCDYNEVSYASKRGGEFSNHRVQKHGEAATEKYATASLNAPNKITVIAFIAPKGKIEDRTFRKLKE